MGRKRAVDIILRGQIEALPENKRVVARVKMVAVTRDRSSPHTTAGWSFIDGVIAPAGTLYVAARREPSAVEKVERPCCRRGVLAV